MSWSIRHEGSPQSVTVASAQQVAEGLQDGLWEPTDEVRGPSDGGWVAIENHPQFEEIALDIEPTPPRVYDDETRLDMNALIDVTLVLLIFFILTTTYAVMQKVIETPALAKDKKEQVVKQLKPEDTDQMIKVTIRRVGDRSEFRVEDKLVEPENLFTVLKAAVRSAKKTDLLLEHDDAVPIGDVVKVQDAAKGAGVEKIAWITP
jgi:biopolymer transport protein ExbD